MKLLKLRFKDDENNEFPSWKKKRLGEFSVRVSRRNSDLQAKRPLTISAEYGLVDQEDYFSKKVASENLTNYYLLKKGEFAYNRSYSRNYPYGSIKRLQKYDCGAISTLYICFDADKAVNPSFLEYYFETTKWHKEANKICYEGARNHGLLNVSPHDFFSISINVPSLSEQRKITDFLTAYDELINNQERRVETLKLRKKGLFKKIFSQEIRFKDDEGREFPAWKKKRLGELASYKKGPFGSTLTKKIFVPKSCNSVKVYEQQNAIKKNWKLERYFIKQEYAEELKNFEVVGGDIIISCAGTIKEQYLLPKDADKGVLNQALMRVRVESNTILPTIFMIYFDDMIRKYGKIYSNGSAMKNIPPLTDMKKTVVQIPTMEEQQKIADFLTTVNKQIGIEEKRLDTMKLIKKGLLQQMFI